MKSHNVGIVKKALTLLNRRDRIILLTSTGIQIFLSFILYHQYLIFLKTQKGSEYIFLSHGVARGKDFPEFAFPAAQSKYFRNKQQEYAINNLCADLWS